MDSATGLKPDVSVSIVTFNNERCVADLLSDLDAQVGASWEAIVYDNASADATCERLDRTEIASLVKGETNLGYSSAHNINIRKCRGRYVLLLNPDVRFAPDTIATLVAHLDRHPGEAMAGPKILEGEHRRHFAPRHFYPGEGMIELEPGINRSEIAWLNGCCILARRDVLERLGGFDEANAPRGPWGSRRGVLPLSGRDGSMSPRAATRILARLGSRSSCLSPSPSEPAHQLGVRVFQKTFRGKCSVLAETLHAR